METRGLFKGCIPYLYSKSYAFQISGQDFYKGEGCNTPGVWLPHLHLHFINMSIIHPFMSLYCMKHACETLQHIVIFHVCLFYEKNSVQHSSATCVTHFSETWLVVLCNTLMKHMKHGFETKVTLHLFFLVSMPMMLDFGVTNVWCG